jgi:hypothetical protein
MYAKLFSRITQSSLMEQDIKTRYVFMMLLAIADSAGDVIGTDIAIARTLNIPREDFEQAIAALMSPDPESNSPEEDGRRVVSSDAGRGYRIVNYTKYREIKTTEEKREYMREYMRRRRNSLKSSDVADVKSCKDELDDVTQGEGYVEEEGEESTVPPDPQGGVVAIGELLHQVKLNLDCPAIDVPKTPRVTRKKVAEPITDEYLSDLQGKYEWVDINREFTKARTWCETNGRVCSRAFFVNWINKISQPPQVKIKQEQVYQ